jgi:dipeptidyl aminopeptidase/acylaminoacyl peptidase
MLPRLTALLSLSLAALACSLVTGQPAADPAQAGTAAAGTLTALAPAASPAPPATATVPAPPPATPTSEPFVCAIAYTDAGLLYCLGSNGLPRLLASGPGLSEPKISPDGQWVAYKAAVAEGVSELWVAGVEPQPAEGQAGPRLLVSNAVVPNSDPAMINSPKDYEWRGGTHTLIFDTRFAPPGGIVGPGDYVNNDLWAVDAVSGAISPLLPAGSAGKFALSPDGAFIAISRAAGLDLLNTDGLNYRPDLVVYPAIITYSEYTYLPEMIWSPDSLYFSVAVPSPDPLAPETMVTFFQVGADGIVQPRSTIPGNFVFGGTIGAWLSPDGHSVVYSQTDAGSHLNLVHRARTDGTSNVVVDQNAVPVGWGWSPDSQFFAYTFTPPDAPGSGYLIEPALGVQPFAVGLTQVRSMQWLDSTSLAFIGRLHNSEWSLYRVALGSEPQLLATGLSDRADLDVR